jgi:hypothetical protein
MGVGVSQPWSATALWTFSDIGISAKEVVWTPLLVSVMGIPLCYRTAAATIRSRRRGLPLAVRGKAQDTKKEMRFGHLEDRGRMFFIT